MDIIHQVVLKGFPTIANNARTIIKIDIIKPKDANRCFLCVDKFLGTYPVASTEKIDIFEIYCDAVQNSYLFNGVNDTTALRSNLLDSFLTSTVVLDPVSGLTGAIFNSLNNKDNWLEIPIDRLNNL